MKNTIILLLGLSLVSGCHPNDPLKKHHRRVRDSKERFREVVEYYKNEPLKLKAAEYLLENIPYHSFIESEALPYYYEYYELFSTGMYTPQEVIDSLKKNELLIQYAPYRTKYDIEEMTSSQVIENIKWACKVYEERPWNKHLSFEDFCESILPYRIGNEPLDVSWRKDLYYRFNPLIEAIEHLPQIEDPLFVAKYILEQLIIPEEINFTTLFPAGPRMGAKRVVNYTAGTCREFSDMVVYVMRALGIACGIDIMFVRGDNNVPHFWNYYLDKEGQPYYSETPDLEIKESVLFWNPKGKVYRSGYAINKTILKELHTYPEEVHPLFYNPLFYDVTEYYSNDLPESLSIPTDYLFDSKATGSHKVIYLCAAKNRQWVPVDYTINNKRNITFRKVDSNVVYWLGVYKENQLEIISRPFLLDKNRKMKLFNEEGNYEEITLFYKFPLFDEFFRERIVGGVFEGSLTKNFTIVDTLHIIRELPERLLNTVLVESDKYYPYVRYFGPDGGYCNMSEVAFYEHPQDSVPLTGVIIGTPAKTASERYHTYANLFDGDPYTSFDYAEPYGGWGGLELDSPRKIGKIIYTSRNRDNFIRIGDLYECFFWKDTGWTSAGKKEATADSIVYKVPAGALLYLKNHTRGNNERIFEYTDGKPYFW